MWIDTHAHLEEGDELTGLLRRAREAGVEAVLAVGGSPVLNRGAETAAARFPDTVAAALGHDRSESALAEDESALAGALELLARRIGAAAGRGIRVAALGETGLDFHYDAATAPLQIALLRRQLDLARRLELPVIVHSRDAEEATLAELRRHRAAWRGSPESVGVLHCFTGSAAFAEALVELDFYISFSGIVSFRNADALRAVAASVPERRLLVETDTPYLAPVPVRGRRNEPSYLPHVAAALASARGCAPAALAAATSANARRLFWRPGQTALEL